MKYKVLSLILFSSINLISNNSIIIKADSLIIDNNLQLKGISKDVIFTTIVTISIFIIGSFIKHLYVFCKEKNRLNSVKKYFFILIKSLKQPLEDQCESYKTLSNNINDFKQYDFAFEENPRLNTEGFRQVSHYDFYKSIVDTSRNNNKESVYVAFVSTVNIIKAIELQKEFADINFREFILRHREYNNSFNSNLNKLLRNYDSEVASRVDGDSFLIEMSKVLSEVKNIDRNAKSIIEEIVNPLYTLLKTKFNDKRTPTFLEITISIRKSYSDLSNMKQLYSKLYEGYSKKMSTMSKKLFDNLRIFEKKH